MEGQYWPNRNVPALISHRSLKKKKKYESLMKTWNCTVHDIKDICALSGNLHKILEHKIYKFPERTLWVKPYCPLFRICQQCRKNAAYIKLYIFLTKVDQIFIKEQYGSTRIVPDSKFSKDAWNKNEIWDFDGIL